MKNKVEINKWVIKNSKKEHWRNFPGYIGIPLATLLCTVHLIFLTFHKIFGSTKHIHLQYSAISFFVSDELKSRNKARLPDFYDVSHAARGLVKIWSTYR